MIEIRPEPDAIKKVTWIIIRFIIVGSLLLLGLCALIGYSLSN